MNKITEKEWNNVKHVLEKGEHNLEDLCINYNLAMTNNNMKKHNLYDETYELMGCYGCNGFEKECNHYMNESGKK